MSLGSLNNPATLLQGDKHPLIVDPNSLDVLNERKFTKQWTGNEMMCYTSTNGIDQEAVQHNIRFLYSCQFIKSNSKTAREQGFGMAVHFVMIPECIDSTFSLQNIYKVDLTDGHTPNYGGMTGVLNNHVDIIREIRAGIPLEGGFLVNKQLRSQMASALNVFSMSYKQRLAMGEPPQNDADNPKLQILRNKLNVFLDCVRFNVECCAAGRTKGTNTITLLTMIRLSPAVYYLLRQKSFKNVLNRANLALYMNTAYSEICFGLNKIIPLVNAERNSIEAVLYDILEKFKKHTDNDCAVPQFDGFFTGPNAPFRQPSVVVMCTENILSTLGFLKMIKHERVDMHQYVSVLSLSERDMSPMSTNAPVGSVYLENGCFRKDPNGNIERHIQTTQDYHLYYYRMSEWDLMFVNIEKESFNKDICKESQMTTMSTFQSMIPTGMVLTEAGKNVTGPSRQTTTFCNDGGVHYSLSCGQLKPFLLDFFSNPNYSIFDLSDEVDSSTGAIPNNTIADYEKSLVFYRSRRDKLDKWVRKHTTCEDEDDFSSSDDDDDDDGGSNKWKRKDKNREKKLFGQILKHTQTTKECAKLERMLASDVEGEHGNGRTFKASLAAAEIQGHNTSYRNMSKPGGGHTSVPTRGKKEEPIEFSCKDPVDDGTKEQEDHCKEQIKTLLYRNFYMTDNLYYTTPIHINNIIGIMLDHGAPILQDFMKTVKSYMENLPDSSEPRGFKGGSRNIPTKKGKGKGKGNVKRTISSKGILENHKLSKTLPLGSPTYDGPKKSDDSDDTDSDSDDDINLEDCFEEQTASSLTENLSSTRINKFNLPYIEASVTSYLTNHTLPVYPNMIKAIHYALYYLPNFDAVSLLDHINMGFGVIWLKPEFIQSDSMLFVRPSSFLQLVGKPEIIREGDTTDSSQSEVYKSKSYSAIGRQSLGTNPGIFWPNSFYVKNLCDTADNIIPVQDRDKVCMSVNWLNAMRDSGQLDKTLADPVYANGWWPVISTPTMTKQMFESPNSPVGRLGTHFATKEEFEKCFFDRGLADIKYPTCFTINSVFTNPRKNFNTLFLYDFRLIETNAGHPLHVYLFFNPQSTSALNTMENYISRSSNTVQAMKPSDNELMEWTKMGANNITNTIGSACPKACYTSGDISDKVRNRADSKSATSYRTNDVLTYGNTDWYVTGINILEKWSRCGVNNSSWVI